ncbi:MAG TPA: hypothetical protein VFI05_11845 [Nitrospiraceae bacterium]|nr:hypothetical protein [Nitrospiraceae bacterium]
MKLPFSLIVILTLTIGGCVFFETNERRFLSHGQGHATQEEVRQRFGSPTLTKTAPSGEPVWVYQIYDWQPGSRVTAPGTLCDEYRLTFDDQRVLRRWTHKTYFHGGEAFPTYCVPDRFYSPVE